MSMRSSLSRGKSQRAAKVGRRVNPRNFATSARGGYRL